MIKFKVIRSKSCSLEMRASQQCLPHENFLDALFGSKNNVMRCFSDIKGIFHIDHFAIKVFDENNKFLVFSSAPSVEYNLIVNGLWQYDMNFFPIEEENRIRVWGSCYESKYYNDLKRIKELEHGFRFGFDVGRVYDGMRVIYTFATRSALPDAEAYYQERLSALLLMAEYAHNEIFSIISGYLRKVKRNTIKLIINNEWVK